MAQNSSRNDAAAASGLGAAGVGAAMLGWLMRTPSSAYGPICGHGAAQLHCPACYASAALVFLGLGLAGFASRPLPSPRRVRVR